MHDVARTIRKELHGLVPSDQAAQMAGRLDELLGGESPDADDRLLAFLAAHEATRARMDELLPDPLEEGERSFQPLPGHSPRPAQVQVYECPVCGYPWPVFEAGEPIPECPKDRVALVPAEGGTDEAGC
jgi:rubrerythrin